MNINDIKYSILCETQNCCIFDCGDAELNEFLKEDAISHQNENMSVTWVATLNTTIIGYYSLLTDSIKKEKLQQSHRIFKRGGKKIYEQYPAMKIGRLAIKKELQRSGYGSNLLKHSIAVSTKLSEHTGCRFITVDSKKNESTLNFYKKNGFNEVIKNSKNDYIPMYLDLLKGLRQSPESSEPINDKSSPRNKI